MNPTVKAVLLNERAAVLSAIAARQGTVSDLLVQINGVENDIWRLRHRLIDLEAYLIGHRVDLPSANGGSAGTAEAAGTLTRCDPVPPAGMRPAEVIGLPACKPLGEFVRTKGGARKAQAAAGRLAETA
ncbi:hypothetical protein PQI07_07810 [Methylobacterium sp. 092160098-2]|uniref:hypothetical protein n=1 Tax=Methylobacterium sp. 092160098-2 TaxID=3025129 RepID=UPI002381AE6A|nr:hypothetical protein [Methylobacterium sp. 092160098-2]MDE4910608.1 hypothetical protein [Methylobacterium sp. 092160098-2]